MQEIQAYKPMLAVKMKDGEVYYIDQKCEAQFLKDINNDRFIKIEGITVNTSDIKRVEPITKLTEILTLPFHQRKTIDAKIAKHYEEMGKYPSEGTIKNMIKNLQ